MIGCGKKNLIIMTFIIIFNIIIIKTDLFDYNWVRVFCDMSVVTAYIIGRK